MGHVVENRPTRCPRRNSQRRQFPSGKSLSAVSVKTHRRCGRSRPQRREWPVQQGCVCAYEDRKMASRHARMADVSKSAQIQQAERGARGDTVAEVVCSLERSDFGRGCLGTRCIVHPQERETLDVSYCTAIASTRGISTWTETGQER